MFSVVEIGSNAYYQLCNYRNINPIRNGDRVTGGIRMQAGQIIIYPEIGHDDRGQSKKGRKIKGIQSFQARYKSQMQEEEIDRKAKTFQRPPLQKQSKIKNFLNLE